MKIGRQTRPHRFAVVATQSSVAADSAVASLLARRQLEAKVSIGLWVRLGLALAYFCEVMPASDLSDWDEVITDTPGISVKIGAEHWRHKHDAMVPNNRK